MAVDKLTPRYLNKDADVRLIKATEFTDAINVRVVTDGEGSAGVVRNIKSNAAVPLGTALPPGINTVVGSYVFDALNAVYVFMHNDLNNHSIYEYVSGQPQSTRLLASDALDFRADSVLSIDGVIYKENAYLYFTDGITDPKKVNIESARAGGYPVGSTKAERLYELNVVKAQPMEPSFVFVTDTSRTDNNIYNKSFQFAAQYVYRDGEVSAIGHYSELAISPNTFNQASRAESYIRSYNKLNVTVDGLTNAVSLVRLYVRENSVGSFRFVEEKPHNSAGVNFEFYNDKIYRYISDDEFNKLYDAVPLVAKAQSITNNRLVYGNYIEGFDKPSITATLTVNYKEVPVMYEIPVDIVSTWTSNRMKFRFDLSNIPLTGTTQPLDAALTFTVGKTQVGHAVLRTFTITGTTAGTIIDTGYTDFSISPFDYSGIIPIPASATRAGWANSLGSALVGQSKLVPVFTSEISSATIVGSAPNEYAVYFSGNATLEAVSSSFIASAVGAPFDGLPVLELNVRINDWDLSAHEVWFDPFGTAVQQIGASCLTSYDNSVSDDTVTGFSLDVTSNTTVAYESAGEASFKSNESHSFGVVYSDAYGRTGGVVELGSVYVEPEYGSSRGTNHGSSNVSVQLTGLAPSWAKKFFFVYGGGSKYSNYTQYAVTEAMVTNETDDDSVYLSLRGLQGVDQSYTDGDGAKIDYVYSEGDRVRIISYKTTSGTIVYPEAYEFDVVGFEQFDDPALSIVDPDVTAPASTATEVENAKKIGYFIKIKSKEIGGFDYAAVSASADLWYSECIVEIYNTKKQVSGDFYYAINGIMDISQHSSTITLEGGNCYYKPRLMHGYKYDDNHTFVADLDKYVTYVESQHFSDYEADSIYYGKGKPSAVIENEAQNNRYSSVTWSEAVFTDSSENVLSSFNNSLANWFDLDQKRGAIYGIADKTDYIVSLQQDGIGLVPINKNILQAGNNLTTINTDFISDVNYYPILAGCQDRRGWVNAEDKTYFADVSRGRIFEVSRQELNNISDKLMSSYFNDEFQQLVMDTTVTIGNENSQFDGYSGRKVVLGYDSRLGELIVSHNTYTFAIVPSEDPDPVFGITRDYSSLSSVYSVKDGVWTHRTNMNADDYSSINGEFLHLRVSSGSPIHKAGSGSTYGYFFGVPYNSYIEAVSVADQSDVKSYNSISIEGDTAASVTLETKSQSASLDSSRFTKKEDSFYSAVPRAAGTSEYKSLGVVASKTSSDVTFSNYVNRSQYRVGGDAYKLSGGSLSSVSASAGPLLSANKVSFSSTSGINVGDLVVVASNSGIDGDPLRGHYMTVGMTIPYGSSPFEIYAVNLEYSQSNIHHTSEQ